MSAVLASPVIKSWQAAFDAQREITAGKREAFADFLTHGLPTTKLDAWKYTDLRRLTMKQFRLATTSDATDVTELLLPLGNCHRIVFAGSPYPRMGRIPMAGPATEFPALIGTVISATRV